MSGCIGLTVLAGFLGQRPKWDGATPSPSGEPTTTEAKRVVIVGYIRASPVCHTTTTQLPAHTVFLFWHIILLVCCYVVQHILQSVELFMVKHTDGIDGYLLCGNLPVCYGGFVHRSVTVRMNRTEIVIDRFRLFLAGIWCCPFVLNIIHHFADCICQNQVLLFDRLYQLYFFHTNII